MDDSKLITSTEYGRAAYPFETVQDETTHSYSYSENDLRIYKKSLLYYEIGDEWSEDYYLIDGMEEKALLLKRENRTGSSEIRTRTIAILHKTQNDVNGTWEYYASGTERECRLSIESTDLSFGKDEIGFFVYDHLGNTRVNYTPTGFISHPGDPSVSVNRINSVVDYFPYGKVLRHYNVTDERYLTTQHERDQETGLDYRGARYYDNEVGRFLSLDPLASEYPSLSDYVYVGDNPIAFVDPDGKKIVFPNEKSREQARTVLKDLGLDKDFRINKRGVLKKRFTPFSKDSELTKGISEKVKSRDVTEVSFTDKENWSVGNYINSDLDIASQDGSGSARVRANYDYDGFPLLNPRDVVLLVISSNGKNDKEVAATFVGGMLDDETAENENKAREQMGIEEVESSSVKTLEDTSPGGSKESSPVWMPSAVNSKGSSGTFNEYYKYFPVTWK